jgi:hypothetical protein
MLSLAAQFGSGDGDTSNPAAGCNRIFRVRVHAAGGTDEKGSKEGSPQRHRGHRELWISREAAEKQVRGTQIHTDKKG